MNSKRTSGAIIRYNMEECYKITKRNHRSCSYRNQRRNFWSNIRKKNIAGILGRTAEFPKRLLKNPKWGEFLWKNVRRKSSKNLKTVSRSIASDNQDESNKTT